MEQGRDQLTGRTAQDLRVALVVRPGLASDTDRITATLTRLAAGLARWTATALERCYEDGDWTGRTRAKTEMKALARELKCDPEAEDGSEKPSGKSW